MTTLSGRPRPDTADLDQPPGPSLSEGLRILARMIARQHLARTQTPVDTNQADR